MTRRVAFSYPASFDGRWHNELPEFACTANAVSLMMPYAEPYVVKAVRRALPHLEGELKGQTEEFLAQEMEHHRQHRRFNDLLVAEEPGLARIESWMRRTFDWLNRTRSEAFGLAFAAGFETVAYTAARWIEARLGRLLHGADDIPATLFLWHLAEEVEHKSVARDVYNERCNSRWTYVVGMVWSMVLLAAFSAVGSTYLLFRQHRLHRPVTYWRMLTWSVSFAFELLPAMAVSAFAGHHPSNLVDPLFYELWLREFDQEAGTMPVWNRSEAAINQQ